jgi:predicted nucleic-acid-binding Zn-ribbon protein
MGLFSKEEPVPVLRKSGKEFACLACGGNRFFKREALLNTPGMTFLNLDWANATAQCYVCGDCGYIHWFLAGS